MEKLTPDEVYYRLLDDYNIKILDGKIQFILGDVDIIVKQKDVVGNIIQEWLEGWFKKREIAYLPSDNPQLPPDFYLDPDDKHHSLLEVKAFNRDASPAFDLADFTGYAKAILKEPWELDTKYLIFGYNMSDEGIVTIKDLWIKNVWEISRSSDKWALNVQYKNGQINKIRPATWYAERAKFPLFQCLEHYLSALEQTLVDYPDTRALSIGWRKKMQDSYKTFSGRKITIPRWEDIEEIYQGKR
jgi:hypothetical protein